MESYAMFAKSKLQEHISEFEKRIREYVPTFAQQVINYHKTEVQVRETFIDYLTRQAKRLRGSFVVEAYKLFGGDKYDEAFKAGIAVEMMHAYLLMIDDFNDLSDLRRGKPTGHRLFQQYLKEEMAYRGDDMHYGYSNATITALLGSHEAINLILSLDLPLKNKVLATKKLNDSIVITAFGQARDIYNAHIPSLKIDDVLEVHRLKTAHYTYMSPLQVGATLAGATEKEISRLQEYATNAGMGFQIQDDILGVFGDPRETGKSNMDDIMEGKATLLTVYAYGKADTSQRKILDSAIGNREITDREFRKVQQIIVDTGSLDYSKNIAHELVSKAKESFSSNFKRYSELDSYKFIVGVADYMVERKL